MTADDSIVSERRLVIRRLRLDDFPAVQEIHRASFPGMESWTDGNYRSQLKVFPEGQIGVELDGRLVGTSTSLIVKRADYTGWHTYKEVSDGGNITNHDPDGDALYGIDIAVHPEFRGFRLARRLYDARKELLRSRNLRSLLIAGRMPRFHQHVDTLPPEDYVAQVLDKTIEDPVITAQVSNGFSILAVLPRYLPSDRESCGHALLLEWLNPQYVPQSVVRSRHEKVRVASVQYRMRPIDSFDAFAQQCSFFIDTASDYRCDFLLFPELLTNQLLALVPAERPALSARRLTEFTDAYVSYFNKMAMKYAVNIIAGTHLTVEDDVLYNISYLFHRNGKISKQYKLHITPSEAKWWGVSAGDSLEVFDTDCGKIAILICYDSEFPELGRVAREKGAQMLFVPFNTDIRSGYMRVRTCTHARCIENHVYAVMSGAVGNLPFVEGADIHYAQSCVLTPSDVSFARDGLMEEASPNAEVMLIHDLDLELLRRTDRTGTVRTWHDRRTDLYQVLWTPENAAAVPDSIPVMHEEADAPTE